MFPPSSFEVFLAPGTTDMRKSINGLSLLVEEQMQLNLFSKYLFGFCNRRRNQIKLLYWDHNGFCLWMKRLEKDRFQWPESNEKTLEITQRELNWLLDGLCLKQHEAHQKQEYISLS